MTTVDALFIVDATPATGFGHAGRCITLAQLLRTMDPSIRIGFQGTFSDNARPLLVKQVGETAMLAPEDRVTSRVAVVDRMHDTEDPNSWDPDVLDDVRSRSRQVIHLTSGDADPHLPEGVTCIGFQPGGPVPRPPALYWGLEYAPVSIAPAAGEGVQRDPERLLVALGGARDDRAMRLAIEAIGTLPDIRSIHILGSPVNDPALLDVAQSWGRPMEIHRNVTSVAPLLKSARVVLASFGHLVYEALASGASVCMLGQKQFQAMLADSLARQGLGVSAGLALQSNAASLAVAIDKAWRGAEEFAARGSRAVDGRGLDRVAFRIRDAFA
jgi:spore coat polysaccharide biosynthesis predicted glycosyltransferase SpsG